MAVAPVPVPAPAPAAEPALESLESEALPAAEAEAAAEETVKQAVSESGGLQKREARFESTSDSSFIRLFFVTIF